MDPYTSETNSCHNFFSEVHGPHPDIYFLSLHSLYIYLELFSFCVSVHPVYLGNAEANNPMHIASQYNILRCDAGLCLPFCGTRVSPIVNWLGFTTQIDILALQEILGTLPGSPKYTQSCGTVLPIGDE